MKTAPIVPARVCWDDPQHPGVPFAPEFGDSYHPRLGAFAQAQHVFLAGNDLPQRWQGRPRFVILETGFGLGHNFLATWATWRADPQRAQQLVFISIEKHPLGLDDLARAHQQDPTPCPEPTLAEALLAQWPPATHDLHRLAFEQGQVQLLLAWGDVATWLPELVAQVDAFYLDGFAPALNPAMWDRHLLRQLARLGTPDATAATWTVAREVRDGLSAAGFSVERRPGFGTKRDMICARRRPSASSAPATPTDPPSAGSTYRPPPPGRAPAPRCRTALVIGAGLAGASAARALAAQGLQVTVLERREHAAAETSGNPAGLFHGVFHRQDGTHAQLLRAAALRAQQHYAELLRVQAIQGACQGLLRGTTAQRTEAASVAHMQGELAERAMPTHYVRALNQADAETLAAMPLAGPAWHYPGGGWISPAELVHGWLRTPGIELRAQQAVDTLRPTAQGGWQALNPDGLCLAEADVVVVAGAQDGLALLPTWTDTSAWPLVRTRGQVTWLTAQQAAAWPLPRPRLPVASGSYLISLPDNFPNGLGGGLLCGATQQKDDDDPHLRAADHASNLSQINDLTGTENRSSTRSSTPAGLGALGGRVGWRLACQDRLPLVGPVPLMASTLAQAGPTARHARLEQPRQVPRVPGLYVLSALGSRGLTLAPLLGEVLAAWITGAPVPLSASLMDAIDPARFISKQRRQQMP